MHHFQRKCLKISERAGVTSLQPTALRSSSCNTRFHLHLDAQPERISTVDVLREDQEENNKVSGLIRIIVRMLGTI